jgi:hypothetical protein
MNKYIIIAVIVSALPACSSISTETYTEKRTLKYPKNGHPHIKEMYLRHHSPSNSHGANPMTPQVYPQGASDDWRYVNPDIPVKAQPTYDDIQNENKMLLVKYYNDWLKE